MPGNLEEKEKCLEKLNQMQKYIPFLDFMIDKIKNNNNEKSLECQLSKFQLMRSMIAEKSGKYNWDIIEKIEDVIEKLISKLDYKDQCKNPQYGEFTEGLHNRKKPKDGIELSVMSDETECKINVSPKDCVISPTTTATTTTVSVSSASNLFKVTTVNSKTQDNVVDAIMKTLKENAGSVKKSNTKIKRTSIKDRLGPKVSEPKTDEALETDLDRDLDGFDLPDFPSLSEAKGSSGPSEPVSSVSEKFSQEDLLSSSREKLLKSLQQKLCPDRTSKPKKYSDSSCVDNDSVRRDASEHKLKSESSGSKSSHESSSTKSSNNSENVKLFPNPKAFFSGGSFLEKNSRSDTRYDTSASNLKQKLREKLSADICEVYKVSGKSVGGSLRSLKDLKNHPNSEEEDYLFKPDKVTEVRNKSSSSSSSRFSTETKNQRRDDWRRHRNYEDEKTRRKKDDYYFDRERSRDYRHGYSKHSRRSERDRDSRKNSEDSDYESHGKEKSKSRSKKRSEEKRISKSSSHKTNFLSDVEVISEDSLQDLDDFMNNMDDLSEKKLPKDTVKTSEQNDSNQRSSTKEESEVAESIKSEPHEKLETVEDRPKEINLVLSDEEDFALRLIEETTPQVVPQKKKGLLELPLPCALDLVANVDNLSSPEHSTPTVSSKPSLAERDPRIRKLKQNNLESKPNQSKETNIIQPPPIVHLKPKTPNIRDVRPWPQGNSLTVDGYTDKNQLTNRVLPDNKPDSWRLAAMQMPQDYKTMPQPQFSRNYQYDMNKPPCHPPGYYPNPPPTSYNNDFRRANPIYNSEPKSYAEYKRMKMKEQERLGLIEPAQVEEYKNASENINPCQISPNKEECNSAKTLEGQHFKNSQKEQKSFYGPKADRQQTGYRRHSAFAENKFWADPRRRKSTYDESVNEDEQKSSSNDKKLASDSEELISPLDRLYPSESKPKQGRGYGIQKFKIPKKVKKPENETVVPLDDKDAPKEKSSIKGSAQDKHLSMGKTVASSKEIDFTADEDLGSFTGQIFDKKQGVDEGTSHVQAEIDSVANANEDSNHEVPDTTVSNEEVLSTSKNESEISKDPKDGSNKKLETSTAECDSSVESLNSNQTTSSNQTNETTEKGTPIPREEITQEFVEALIRKSFQSGEGKLLLAQAKLFEELTRKLNSKKLKTIQKIINSESDSDLSSSESSSEDEKSKRKGAKLSKSKKYKKKNKKQKLSSSDSDSSDEQTLDQIRKSKKAEEDAVKSISKVSVVEKEEVDKYISPDDSAVTESPSKTTESTKQALDVSKNIKKKRKQRKKSQKLLEEILSEEPAQESAVETSTNSEEVLEKDSKHRGKPRGKSKTELDRLHEDIKSMFIHSGEVTVTGQRMCRILKESGGNMKTLDIVKESAKMVKEEKLKKRGRPRSKNPRKGGSVNQETIEKQIVRDRSTSRARSETAEENVSNNIEKDETLGASVMKLMSELSKKQLLVSLRQLDLNDFAYGVKISEYSVDFSRMQGRNMAIRSKRNSTFRNRKYFSPKIFLERNKRKCERLKNKKLTKGYVGKNLEDIVKNLPLKMLRMKHLEMSEKNSEKKSRPTAKRPKKVGRKNKVGRPKQSGQAFCWTTYAFNRQRYSYPCLLCRWFTKNITSHYKYSHPESEVLISRLAKTEAQRAIAESVALNWDSSSENSGWLEKARKKIKTKLNSSGVFRCRMCKSNEILGVEDFCNHVIGHTGEYRFQCPYEMCLITVPSRENLTAHIQSKHTGRRFELYEEIVELFPLPVENGSLFGYLCSACNYVQILRENVERHIRTKHSGEEGVRSFKIDMCSQTPLRSKGKTVGKDGSELMAGLDDVDVIGDWIPEDQIEMNETEAQDSDQSDAKNKFDENYEYEGFEKIKPLVPAAMKHDWTEEVSNTEEKEKEEEGNDASEMAKEDESVDLDDRGTLKENDILESVDAPGNSSSVSLSDSLFKEIPESRESGPRLKVGPLEAQILDNFEVLYECYVKGCLFFTKVYDLFERHINISHWTTKWDGTCGDCLKKPEEKVLPPKSVKLIAALKHLKTHETLKIAELKGLDSEPEVKNEMKLASEEGNPFEIDRKSVLIENIETVTKVEDNIEIQENGVEVKAEEGSDSSFPPKPLLRVRNLLGDRLSTPKESGNESSSHADINEDETTMFTIENVRSLQSETEMSEGRIKIEQVCSAVKSEVPQITKIGNPVVVRSCPSRKIAIRPDSATLPIAVGHLNVVQTPIAGHPVLLSPINSNAPIRILTSVASPTKFAVQPLLVSAESSLINSNVVSVISPVPTVPTSAVTGAESLISSNVVSVISPVCTTAVTASAVVPKSEISILPQSKISIVPQKEISIVPQNEISIVPQNEISIVPQNEISVVPQSELSVVPKNEISIIPQNELAVVPQKELSIVPQSEVSIVPVESASNLTAPDPKPPAVQKKTKVRSTVYRASNSSTPPLPVMIEEPDQKDGSSKLQSPRTRNKSVKDAKVYQEMLAKRKLCHLFKCMSTECSFTSHSESIFTQHLGLHEAQAKLKADKKGSKNLHGEKSSKLKKIFHWQQCAYCCEVLTNTGFALSQHIIEEHGHCIYQCGFCFYRAVSLSYVEIHQTLAHSQTLKSSSHLIYKCKPICEKPLYSNLFEKLVKKQCIRPYHCDQCGQKFYIAQDFVKHLTTKHQSVTAYTCHICKNLCFKADRLIGHYKLHSYCTYQCPYCLRGTETEREMMFHLSNFHFSQPPVIYVRALADDKKNDASEVDSLKIIFYEKTSVDSDCIEEEDTDDDIVETEPRSNPTVELSTELMKGADDRPLESVSPIIKELASIGGKNSQNLLVQKLLPNAQFSSENDKEPEVCSVLISSGLSSAAAEEKDINIPLGQLPLESQITIQTNYASSLLPSDKTSSSGANSETSSLTQKEKTDLESQKDVEKSTPVNLPAAIHKLLPAIPTRNNCPKFVYTAKSSNVLKKKPEEGPTQEAKETDESILFNLLFVGGVNKENIIDAEQLEKGSGNLNREDIKKEPELSLLPKSTKDSSSGAVLVSSPTKENNKKTERRKSTSVLEPPIIRVEDFFEKETNKEATDSKLLEESPKSPEVVIIEPEKNVCEAVTVVLDSDEEKDTDDNSKTETSASTKVEVPVLIPSDTIRKEMELLRNQIVHETDSLLIDTTESESSPKVKTTDKDVDILLSPIEEAICSLNKALQSKSTKSNENAGGKTEKPDDCADTPRTRSGGKEKIKKDDSEESMDKNNDEDSNAAVESKKEDPNKIKKAVEGLSGKELFICGNEKCSFSAENDSLLKDHLLVCDVSRESLMLTCPHCKKQVKQVNFYIEHLKFHGEKKYFCGLCSYSSAVVVNVSRHLKQKHKSSQTKSVPKDPPNERHLLFYPKNHKIDKPDFEVNGYSPGDEDKLPLQSVYQVNVKCAKCPYFTKVRSNMVRHLKIHLKSVETEGSVVVPSTAPTNPVPCLDTKERMFDKMTNLAASSQLAQAKEKTILESLSPEEEAKLPQFVAEQMRYKCCLPDCKYITVDDGMLKHHIKALHDEINYYSCPHCRSTVHVDVRNVTLDKLGHHLRHHDSKLYKCPHCIFFHYQKTIVEKHTLEKHPEKRYFVYTVREPKLDATPEEETCEPAPKAWKCGFCDDFQSSSRVAVQEHLSKKHNTKSKYKCSLCCMKSNHYQSFFSHFANKHVGEKVSYTRSIIQINSSSDYHSGSSGADLSYEQFDTTPLWQRGAPRVRHIRGILIEEEEVKTKKSKKTNASTESESGDSPAEMPRNAFFCPLCSDKKKFCTRNADLFRSHLYQELNYQQFACILCGKMFVDRKDYEKHHAKAHPDKPFALKQTKEDGEIMFWVDKVIAKQREEMQDRKRRLSEEGESSDGPGLPKKKK